MSFKPQIWYSDSSDPVMNLAFEECVLDDPRTQLPSLVLYENSEVVVIGKNQNPWLECDPEHLEHSDIPMLRRLSGGGTVYHGYGNLNIGFVVARSGFERRRQLELVSEAITALGVKCEILERGDILVGGRKVSGNAMCYRSQRVLHHITLLVNTDLGALRGALRPAEPEIETHAIASNRMPVANLSESNSSINIDSVRHWIVYTFNNVYSVGEYRSARDLDPACLAERSERHRSWEWKYGRTPRFVAPGYGDTRLSVSGGFVRAVVTRDGTEFALKQPRRYHPKLREVSLAAGRTN